jgi:hypothetical protein
MKHAILPLAGQGIASTILVLRAARIWRAARDARQPVQPSIFATLRRYGCGVLAPVFDSLMTLCEAALGRRLHVGSGGTMSDDEHLLLDLLKTPNRVRTRMSCDDGPAAAFNCALRSTRVMIALALDHRPAVSLSTG